MEAEKNETSTSLKVGDIVRLNSDISSYMTIFEIQVAYAKCVFFNKEQILTAVDLPFACLTKY